MVLGAVLVVIALLGAGGAAIFVFVNDDGDDVETAASTEPSDPDGEVADRSSSDDREPGDTAGDQGSATTESDDAPTVEVPTTSVSVPDRSSSSTPSSAARPFPVGSWVVVRISVRDRATAADFLSNVPGGTVLATDNYPSLAPGYWAVVVGPYSTDGEAVAACRAAGLNDRNSCFGAYLSDDPTDRDRRVYPD